ncbi:hypothetical protein HBZS_105230 [Helicobacter bizzozeronii CCUG 35545]|nr:hypothetical protein HBZS_105230 [Helicobacter bizzozeronii CCUG 35545]
MGEVICPLTCFEGCRCGLQSGREIGGKIEARESSITH